ncbi:MAG: hypothetical protein HRT44_10960 [Bdellovibrionales bacterium]|nr:hypothetical protein [Bdellovibrionales bacterium]NQZ19760.1 hypothetical protein [Bdellovibrionales bacterium]
MGYTSVNNDWKTSEVETDEENNSYIVRMALENRGTCTFTGLKMDNSQPDTWIPGAGGDRCADPLIKSVRIKDFFIYQVSGFIALNAPVRAITINKSYELENLKSLQDNPLSNGALNTMTNDLGSTLRAEMTKVYIPPQIETHRVRRTYINSKYVHLNRRSDIESEQEQWVSSGSVATGLTYRWGIWDYDIRAQFDRLTHKSDQSLFLDLADDRSLKLIVKDAGDLEGYDGSEDHFVEIEAKYALLK